MGVLGWAESKIAKTDEFAHGIAAGSVALTKQIAIRAESTATSIVHRAARIGASVGQAVRNSAGEVRDYLVKDAQYADGDLTGPHGFAPDGTILPHSPSGISTVLSSDPVLFVNGILNTIDQHSASARRMSNDEGGRRVVGVYNRSALSLYKKFGYGQALTLRDALLRPDATAQAESWAAAGLVDSGQAFLDEEALGSNPATGQLFNALKGKSKAKIVGHSQGSLIVVAALRRLAKVQSLGSGLIVDLIGSQAISAPRGPTYLRLVGSVDHIAQAPAAAFRGLHRTVPDGEIDLESVTTYLPGYGHDAEAYLDELGRIDLRSPSTVRVSGAPPASALATRIKSARQRKNGTGPRLPGANSRYRYNLVTNPGPLLREKDGKRLAATFRSGMYRREVLTKDTFLYRAGTRNERLKQFYTKQPPRGEIQARDLGAVEREWVDRKTGRLTGFSPMETVHRFRVPAGTVVYVGPAGYQSPGAIGGGEQIVIPDPERAGVTRVAGGSREFKTQNRYLVKESESVPDGGLTGPFGPDGERVPDLDPDSAVARGATIFVNGINTDQKAHEAAARRIAKDTKATVVGVYNATAVGQHTFGIARDVLQSAGDKFRDAGKDPATKTLKRLIMAYGDASKKRGGLKIEAHSQGSIIVSEALRECAAAGKDLHGHHVVTWGTAAYTFPKGPEYHHRIHSSDAVATTVGAGSYYARAVNAKGPLRWAARRYLGVPLADAVADTHVLPSKRGGIGPHLLEDGEDGPGYLADRAKFEALERKGPGHGTASRNKIETVRAFAPGLPPLAKCALSAARTAASLVVPGFSHPAAPPRGRKLQRKGFGGEPNVDAGALLGSLLKTGGAGAALAGGVRERLSPALGFDPGGARLHMGPAAAAAARSLNAEAFTIGSHVFFGANRHDSASAKGLGLLAHELTHVGQQAGGLGLGSMAGMEEAARTVGHLVEHGLADHRAVSIGRSQVDVVYDGVPKKDHAARIDAISAQAVDEATRRLEALRMPSLRIDALEVDVELDLDRMSDEECADRWADAIVAAARAHRPAAKSHVPGLQRSEEPHAAVHHEAAPPSPERGERDAGVTIALTGLEAMHAGDEATFLREMYNRGAQSIQAEALARRGKVGDEALARWVVEARNKLKAQVRDQGPALWKSIAETRNKIKYKGKIDPTYEMLREAGKSDEQIIRGASRTSETFNGAGRVLRGTGRVLGTAGILLQLTDPGSSSLEPLPLSPEDQVEAEKARLKYGIPADANIDAHGHLHSRYFGQIADPMDPHAGEAQEDEMAEILWFLGMPISYDHKGVKWTVPGRSWRGSKGSSEASGSAKRAITQRYSLPGAGAIQAQTVPGAAPEAPPKPSAPKAATPKSRPAKAVKGKPAAKKASKALPPVNRPVVLSDADAALTDRTLATVTLDKKTVKYAEMDGSIAFKGAGKSIENKQKDDHAVVYREAPSLPPVPAESDYNKTDSLWKRTGLTAQQARIFSEVSQREGGWGSVNAYDSAVVSAGMIQFAGGGRSLERLLATLKESAPASYQSLFGDFGIFVEYDYSGEAGQPVDPSKITRATIVARDPAAKKLVRGNAALQTIRKDFRMLGTFVRAGGNADYERAQLLCAKALYYDKAVSGDKMFGEVTFADFFSPAAGLDILHTVAFDRKVQDGPASTAVQRAVRAVAGKKKSLAEITDKPKFQIDVLKRLKNSYTGSKTKRDRIQVWIDHYDK